MGATLSGMELIDRVRALQRRQVGRQVAADAQAALLEQDGVAPMVKGGRTSRGWVHVDPHVVAADAALGEWLDRGVAAARASVSPAP